MQWAFVQWDIVQWAFVLVGFCPSGLLSVPQVTDLCRRGILLFHYIGDASRVIGYWFSLFLKTLFFRVIHTKSLVNVLLR